MIARYQREYETKQRKEEDRKVKQLKKAQNAMCDELARQ